MKNKFKKLLVLLCVLTCAVSICGCGKEVAVEYDEAALISMSEYIIESIITPMPTESVQYLKDTYEASELESQLYETGLKIDGEGLYDAFDSWLMCREEIGEVDGVDSVAVTNATEDEITVVAKVTGDSGKTAQVAPVPWANGHLARWR